MEFDRRRALVSAAGIAVGGMATARLLPEEMLLRDRRPSRSRVAILSVVEYAEGLVDTLTRALRLFELTLRDRSVLLKPNLVEYIASAEVNTNPVLVGAAAEAFLKLGARSVVVAEGPGHQRDTHLVLTESGLGPQLRSQKIAFIDLNRDELTRARLRANYTGLDHLWLPRTVLASDFVVSMPKIKTHHWAGVTLSMKNMFGIVPGTKYGWPKNVLHWEGGQFMIQPADSPSVMIPQTVGVGSTATVSSASSLSVPIVPASSTSRSGSKEQPGSKSPAAENSAKADRTALDELLDRQRRAPLPVLYGQKPGISAPGKELVKTGVSEVIDQGSEVVVLFSAVNVQDHAVELMPPQIQLGGKKKSGKIIRKSRWSTAEQLPVTDFRMSRRRLGPGERADGVVVFQRPSFKQSTETLFLQMAESGAVDRPALAPIGFGISSFREVTYDAR